jgi:hypothetical protein
MRDIDCATTHDEREMQHFRRLERLTLAQVAGLPRDTVYRAAHS